ncbi:hypothetical protein V8B97DRAFT_2025726 [Scleroderma yunnanense]
MCLINVKAFIERERKISLGWPANSQTKVLEFRDDETTAYAILSHRWVGQEVDHDEMRGGYQKTLDSRERAKRDGYEWLWVDTCCIDKRSSAELSEVINSMYRWYETREYPSFPALFDHQKYPHSNGWPEWFSRGWTLQEIIAPSNVQFFNRDWRCIGNKRSLAETLSRTTRVSEYTLTDASLIGINGSNCDRRNLMMPHRQNVSRLSNIGYTLLVDEGLMELLIAPRAIKILCGS